MTLVGQPPPSAVLWNALELLARGEEEAAEAAVKQAALEAKKRNGSGSQPLALAYADLGRLHLRMGAAERAAREFQHAANSPAMADPQHARDRLAMQLGFGVSLGALGRFAEAETILRQCLAQARKLDGAHSALAAVALVPLAELQLKMGRTVEAAKLADGAYDALWNLGDPLFASTVGTHAEVHKAQGRTENPFTDLANLPESMIADAVANALARAGHGDIGRVRALLADMLAFVDQKFGDGHTLTYDALAAIAHHESAAGKEADEKVKKSAVRRFLWSRAVRQVPGGLLTNLEIGFEPGGVIHLAPHLARDSTAEEIEQLEATLKEALDDLQARPALRP